MGELRSLDHNASALLTSAFRAGQSNPDFTDYEQAIRFGHAVDTEAAKVFLDQAMAKYSQAERTDSDVWLGPRLHYSLRMTRREAADRGLWRWLGVVFAPDYVRWRWASTDKSSDGKPGAANLERFVGAETKHALARLWWMAELFRDGSDYGPAAAALGNQDIINNLFRMNIAHHRPTVQAAVRVLEGKSGRDANALAKAVNAAASTLKIDVIGVDVPLDPAASDAWINGDIDPVQFFERMPEGPNDLKTPPGAVDSMVELLQELYAEAPVRGDHE